VGKVNLLQSVLQESEQSQSIKKAFTFKIRESGDPHSTAVAILSVHEA
jgi:hypothetical protein